MSTYLSLRWTTSKAHDTYGYNVVTLTDESTGKRYRAMGGGYDMVGTVFGHWLEDNYQLTISRGHPGNLRTIREGLDGLDVAEFYGARRREDGTVALDGACGIESMLSIAKALGVKLERTYKRTGANRGETTGWVVA